MVLNRTRNIASLILFYTFFLFTATGLAQVCSGNLGENIFTNGDFGSGFENVVQIDPQIAPGYIYETNPPPQDGKYTISNYTGLWNYFDGWINTYDNSTDPKGYMMVVNASYDPGLFYSQQIDGLCENTLYEFSADILNLLAIGSNMIKPNVSFLLDGVEMYSTGDIPENETWQTYGFTFETQPGQNAINLSLRNNAPGGIGNDLALDNISFKPCGPEAVIIPSDELYLCVDNGPVTLEAILLDNSYDNPVLKWQLSLDEGNTWTDINGADDVFYTHSDNTPGTYYYRYLVANGVGNLPNYKCRIASSTKIIVVLPKFTYTIDTICNGLSVDFGDSTYNETGIYHDTLTNFLGCDSILVLDLTITSDEPLYADHTVINPPCSSDYIGTFYIDTVYNGFDPYNLDFAGVSYDIDEVIDDLDPGKYHFTITDRFGCEFSDSIVMNPTGLFTIDLGEDMVIELGESVHLIPESDIQIDNYLWRPSDVTDCVDNCTELKFSPTSSMYVYAEATNDKNCTVTDSIFIEVIKNRKVYIPNAFTPNNDGLNDNFTVYGTVPNIKMIEKMLIFNRWGQNIYQQEDFLPNDPDSGWDGTFNGTTLGPGTFIYSIDIRFFDNDLVNYQGHVTIIK